MRIKRSLPADFYEQGFTNETDPFALRDLAQGLTKVFATLEHGTVSILDGRWGSGKTTFARQWSHHLKQNGIPAIYFDAFASDYIRDPFQAVSSSFIKAAQEARKEDAQAYQRFVDAAAKASKRIGSTAAKLTAKVVTLGIIGAAEIDELAAIKDDLATALSEVSDEAVKSFLEEQAGAEATFIELRASLSGLPALLAPESEDGQTEGTTNLVIIIDELDRCRPDFALGVLETLKHFFRADGLHFVLVTSMAHLIQSVRGSYGINDNAEEYLEKFYDFVVHFEESFDPHRGPRSKAYLDTLIRDILANAPGGRMSHNMRDQLKAITSAYNLSLRQVENLVTNVALSLHFMGEKQYAPDMLVAHLCALKAVAPLKYQRAKVGMLSYEDFAGFVEGGRWDEHYGVEHVMKVFRYHMDSSADPDSEEFRGFGEGLLRFGFRSRLDMVPYLCTAVIDRFGR